MNRSTTLRRLDALIWVLVYGGLLALVLGLSVGTLGDSSSGWLVAGGALATALGVLLFIVRARLPAEPEDASRS